MLDIGPRAVAHPPIPTMKILQFLLAPLALAAWAAPAPDSSNIGKTLPTAPVEGLTQTKAKSLDDYLGRALLVEFFAYW